MDNWKLITAKKISTCEICSKEFPIGTKIYWSRGYAFIRCVDDLEPREVPVLEVTSSGVAGESAQEMFVKKQNRTRDARKKILGEKLGSVANFVLGDTQDTKNWKQGAIGERKVGETLDAVCKEFGYRALHDRAIPGSKANIDHILVSDRGVIIIDAKNYTGMVRIDEQGGILSPLVTTLYVGTRKQTKLVVGVKKQVSLVAAELKKAKFDIPAVGALAFHQADWPLFFKPTLIDGVLINSKGIRIAIQSLPIVEGIDIPKVHSHLGNIFTSKIS